MKKEPFINKSSIVKTVALWILIVACYAAVASYLRQHTPINDLLESSNLESSLIFGFVFWLILILSLLLPLSSATIIVLLGVDLFGPWQAFNLSFSAGVTAAALSYAIGYCASRINWKQFNHKLDKANEILKNQRKSVFLLTIVVRAVPNPLYDIWGYACGFLRIKFWLYFLSSIIGGTIPVVILCFFQNLIH